MEIKEIEQAVILAGGKGTRLSPFTDHMPKPMYQINGVPFISHLINQVKGFGCKKVLLLLGYKSEKIIEYLGNGEQYGIRIEYDVTPVEYDTGERLLAAKDKIDENFLLMYCDNYCPISYKKLWNDFKENKAIVQLSAYCNADNYTKDNLFISVNGCILKYDKKRECSNLKGVDIGYALTDKKAIDIYEQRKTENNQNFEAVVYPYLVESNVLYATVTKHRYYSIGSWERITLTEEFFSQKKTIFLDRDGTINVRPPKACYVESVKDFVWLPRAKEAIKLLKDHGYRIILVTNQPGIARKRLSEDRLRKIHENMQNELRRDIGYEIDAIYYCPHNWDENCECRKPKPGMLYQAQKDFSLDLTQCVLIGDDERDIQAGEEAGCRCFQVSDTYDLYQAVSELNL